NQSPGNGQEHQHENGQFPTDENHAQQGKNNGQGLFDKHLEHFQKGSLDDLHVTGDAGDEIAFSFFGEIGHRQFDDLGINVVANVPQHAVLKRSDKIFGQIAKKIL